MRIYPIINVSQVVRYREPVKRQKVEESRLAEVNREEEWKVEKKLKK